MQKFIYLILLFLISTLSWSQLTQEQLEARKQKLQEEIQEKEMQLQSVKKKEKSVVKLLIIQGEKIGLKEKLINNTEKQKKLLTNNIYLNQLAINKLRRELEILKTDYAEMIVKSYKSRSEQSRAMFILSSENFLQAYKRAQYMKQYSSYRKMQGEEIKDKNNKLDQYNLKLGGQRKEKEQVIAEQEKQKQDLLQEKQEQLKIANSLKKDKRQITAEIKTKQKEARVIDRQVQRLIREAIAEANRKTAASRAKANPKTTTATETKAVEESVNIVLTPEGQLISNNFKANKGRLPWPVERGAITLGYGDVPHPVYKSLTIHNSGLEITTDAGASARAVFGGEVTRVIVISPINKAVCIQHGDFFTIYQNLGAVYVNAGDKVSTKQAIGKIRTNAEGKTVIKFMISQNTTYTNPAGWLNR
ncbi:MAG: peptidoglycan DD-metalloendopeptidase family protein [Flavobacterium sp.]|nr:peptidoglycan DD-metalloendopeptidase family protein [Flavobacterium sp.]